MVIFFFEHLFFVIYTGLTLIDMNGNNNSVMFVGSEDYIRWQFEDYIMALLSSVKYDGFLQKYGNPPPPEALLPAIGMYRE